MNFIHVPPAVIPLIEDCKFINNNSSLRCCTKIQLCYPEVLACLTQINYNFVIQ